VQIPQAQRLRLHDAEELNASGGAFRARLCSSLRGVLPSGRKPEGNFILPACKSRKPHVAAARSAPVTALAACGEASAELADNQALND
jgi:hypothetical protein